LLGVLGVHLLLLNCCQVCWWTVISWELSSLLFPYPSPGCWGLL
jgi:hypothetical protein